MPKLEWPALEHPPLNSPNCRAALGNRQGVMIHYDASSTDAGSLGWLAHPDCKVSYNEVVLDDGSWCRIVPSGKTAYHAGRCRPSSDQFHYFEVGTSHRHTANHAFIGIAIANGGKEDVYPRQLLTLAWRVAVHFKEQGWHPSELWRITGHRQEAWPRGRKADPEGASLTNPIVSPNDVKDLLPLIFARLQ